MMALNTVIYFSQPESDREIGVFVPDQNSEFSLQELADMAIPKGLPYWYMDLGFYLKQFDELGELFFALVVNEESMGRAPDGLSLGVMPDGTQTGPGAQL